MTLTEMIAKLEKLRATYGDVEFMIYTDEGSAVYGNSIDVHLENNGGETILAFYH